jgi:hypothetical protein
MKIRPVGAELFYADGRTGMKRANRHFSQVCDRSYNISLTVHFPIPRVQYKYTDNNGKKL